MRKCVCVIKRYFRVDFQESRGIVLHVHMQYNAQAIDRTVNGNNRTVNGINRTVNACTNTQMPIQSLIANTHTSLSVSMFV